MRYFNKNKLSSLAGSASDTLLFGPENIPFGNISLWIYSKVNVAWVIDFCDLAGNESSPLGGTIANGSGSYVSHYPEAVFTLAAILPPIWRLRAKVTNSDQNLADIQMAWVGFSYQF